MAIPFKFPKRIVAILRGPLEGIATPVCAPARNDMLCLYDRVNNRQAAPFPVYYPVQEAADFRGFNAAVDFREAKVVEIGEMVGADPETGGIEGIQSPDTAAQGAALHPQEVGLA